MKHTQVYLKKSGCGNPIKKADKFKIKKNNFLRLIRKTTSYPFKARKCSTKTSSMSVTGTMMTCLIQIKKEIHKEVSL